MERLAEITSMERENFHAWIIETPAAGNHLARSRTLQSRG